MDCMLVRTLSGLYIHVETAILLDYLAALHGITCLLRIADTMTATPLYSRMVLDTASPCAGCNLGKIWCVCRLL